VNDLPIPQRGDHAFDNSTLNLTISPPHPVLLRKGAGTLSRTVTKSTGRVKLKCAQEGYKCSVSHKRLFSGDVANI